MLDQLTWYACVALAAYAAFIFVCHLPIVPMIRLAQIDVPNKGSIAADMLRGWVRCMAALPFDLVAPIVVPVALLFTRWGDDKLPALFKPWDNDASINGDVRTDDPADGLGGWALRPVPVEDTPEARAMCYWAPGHHPRSFYARWIWLGLRNRASMMSQILGVHVDGQVESWEGDSWKVSRVGDCYRYFELLPFGPVKIRMHCGFKVPRIPGAMSAPPVSIGFSLRRN